MTRTLLAALVAVSPLASASAQDFGSIREDVRKARVAVETLEQNYLQPALLRRDHAVTARISDGQLFYVTGDFERASMVLLDVAERKGVRSHPGYPDALFFLADSLFHLRNFKASAAWFEQVTRRGNVQQRERAVGRLLEIAVATRDAAAAELWLQRAEQLLRGSPDPALLYAVGKFHDRRGETAAAAAAFSRVPADHVDWYRARYYLGVIHVKQKKFEDALSVFEELVTKADAVGGLNERQTKAVDAARLAVGRIHYERAQFSDAVAAYAAVPRHSKVFDQALYESVWISIKEGQFEKALRKLEIQLISQPEVIRGPQARLLQGKLLVMLARYKEATNAFQEVLYEFEPMQADMRAVARLNNGDLVSHFNSVIGRNFAEFDLSSFLPGRTAEFAGSDVEADRALQLVSDLSVQNRDVSEMRRTIRRLEVALNANNRIEIFPQLSEGWLKAAEIRARTVALRARILEAAAKKFTARPTEYRSLSSARREAGARYADVPRSTTALLARDARVDDQIRAVDQELFKLDLAIRGLQAQLAAITRYIADRSRVGGPSDRDRNTLAKVDLELAQAQQLRDQLRALGEQIEIERIQVGVGDDATTRDERTRLAYVTALEAETEWLRQRGVALPSDLLAATRDVDARAARFQRSAADLVDEEVVDLRRQVAREKKKIGGYETDLGEYQARTETLGGAIAARNFRHVLGRIDGLVLEADVGLIDVAWKHKQDKSDQISRLLQRQAADLQALDRNYREVRGD